MESAMRSAMIVVLLAAALLLVASPTDAGNEKKEEGEKPTTVYPVLKSKTDPEFPSSLVRQGIGVQIDLLCVVGTDGAPSEIEVLKCVLTPDDKSDEYCPSLETMAIETVNQWRWEPGTIDGTATEMYAPVMLSLNPPRQAERKRKKNKKSKKKEGSPE